MSAEASLTSATKVVRSPEQVSGDLDGKVVLLSIENGEYYNMNEVGSRIWSLLEKPTTVAGLIDTLVTEFEVTREQCEREALAFLEQLRTDKLLRIDAS